MADSNINGGDLCQRIDIEQSVPAAANEYGGPGQTDKWSVLFGRVPAMIESLSPREFEYAKSFAATVNHRITLRYMRGIKPTMRVKYCGSIYAINGVIDVDKRRRKLLLYCTENPT